MRFRIEFSAEAECDFALIFDHLFESYRGFGESVEAALDHSEARIHEIRQEADRLCAAPFRGERHDDLLPGLRHLTIDRAIYWFEVNEAKQRARSDSNSNAKLFHGSCGIVFGGQGDRTTYATSTIAQIAASPVCRRLFFFLSAGAKATGHNKRVKFGGFRL